MSEGRFYNIPIDGVAVSAPQDLFGLLATANMAFQVWELYLGQKTLTTAEMRQIVCKCMPATATVGSGGSAATPRKLGGSGDTAATFTARINDTTPQTTGGTAEVVYSDVWYFTNQNFIWLPRKTGRIIQPSQGFVVNLPTAPSGSMTVSGNLVVRECF